MDKWIWYDLSKTGFDLKVKEHSSGSYLFMVSELNSDLLDKETYKDVQKTLLDAGFKPFSFGFAGEINRDTTTALSRLPYAEKIKVNPEDVGYDINKIKSKGARNERRVRTNGEETHAGVSSGNVSGKSKNGNTGELSGGSGNSGGSTNTGKAGELSNGKSNSGTSKSSGASKKTQSDSKDDKERSVGDLGVSGAGTGEYPLNTNHFYAHGIKMNRENFRFNDRFKENFNAISLLYKHKERQSPLSREKQEILFKYNGWGGLQNIFDQSRYPFHLSDNIQKMEEMLTKEEYEDARASVNTSFYTPSTIAENIWDLIQATGFKGGKILEPALGIGHFFAYAPEDVVKNSYLTGIEIDSISANIAKKLYPDADIKNTGFEKTNLLNNSYDVVLTNVPFGNYNIYDSSYAKHSFPVHDYFIVKSLDKLKSGGIGVFITSSYTMDKKSEKARTLMAKKGDLIGALRLPSNLFYNFAGADIVTDVLIFRKRDHELKDEDLPSWVHTENMPLEKKDRHTGITYYSSTIPINSYFVDNPDLIAGDINLNTNRFGKYEMGVSVKDEKLEEHMIAKFSNFKKVVTENFAFFQSKYPVVNSEQQNTALEDQKDFIESNYEEFVVGSYVLDENNNVLKVISAESEGKAEKVNLSGKRLERLREMVVLKNALIEVLEAQKRDSEDNEYLQKRDVLNSLYDNFVLKHGYLNSSANRQVFLEDPYFGSLMALEIYDEKIKEGEKADIFFQRVIASPNKTIEVGSIQEAISVSLNDKGYIDSFAIAGLLGKKKNEVEKMLIDSELAFVDPETSKWISRHEYLSGDVKEKLEKAKEALKYNTHFEHNIKALEEIQPEDLTPAEIDVKLGVPWISAKLVEKFANDIAGSDIFTITYRHTDGEWVVDGNAGWLSSTRPFGTTRRPFHKLLQAALSQSSVQVYDTIEDENGNERRVLNYKETVAAEEKISLIQQEFRKFIWEHDEDVAKQILADYNRIYNCYVDPKYDGSHLTFPGMSMAFTPRGYQKDAVWQLLHKNELIAHEVGLGKTFVQVAGAMEMKRLGKAHKPLLVVPNHMLEQIDRESRQIYPGAKILCVTKKDFAKQKRTEFIGKVVNNNWDMVIMTHSMFERIQNDPSFEKNMLVNVVENYREELTHAKETGERKNTKEIERKIKSFQGKLDKMQDAEKDNTGIYFDDLGIDALFVDEAHKYKNLDLFSSSSDVSSSISGSKRAWDLYLKTRWIYEKRGEEYGVHFATGTPVTNNPFEIFNMQRYLQESILEKTMSNHANAWAANFLTPKTTFEPNHAGTGFKRRTRFALSNIPELMRTFKMSMNIKSADEVGIKRPKPVKTNVVSPMSDDQSMLMKKLDEDMNKGVHVFTIMHQGRMMALDPRTLDEHYEDFDDSKINNVVSEVYKKWQETTFKKGVQLIFCDLSVPKKGRFNVYDDIREKLVEKGVPREEIQFIHEHANDQQKASLFHKTREGEVRVLMGSTGKMGEGMNAQDKLVALHHVDAPWTPAGVDQREGRIIRFGNENEKVDINIYTTKDTFDLFLWNLLKLKNEQFSKVLRGKSNLRNFDFEVSPTYAETAAITSGNPMIKEKLEIEHEIVKMENLTKHHHEAIIKAKNDLRIAQINKESKNSFLNCLKELPNINEDSLIWKVDLNKYGIEKEFEGPRDKLLPIINKLTDTFSENHFSTIDNIEFGGVSISFSKTFDSAAGKFLNLWELNAPPHISRERAHELEHILTNRDKLIEKYQKDVTEYDVQMEGIKDFLNKPSEYKEKLAKLYARRAEIDLAIENNNGDDIKDEEVLRVA